MFYYWILARMQRIHLYLKVVADADDTENPQRLGKEICRQIQKIYGVRTAELSNHSSETLPDDGD
jgi:hypothetical protein